MLCILEARILRMVSRNIKLFLKGDIKHVRKKVPKIKKQEN